MYKNNTPIGWADGKEHMFKNFSKASNMLLYCTAGSHSFGLNAKDSDEDHVGLYVNPTQDYWKINSTPSDYHEEMGEVLDVKFFEIQKFLSLAAQCNPNMLDILFTDTITYKSHWGELLLSIRQKFLQKRIRNSYFGYANQQFQRWKNKDKFSKNRQSTEKKRQKHIRHTFRLYEHFEGMCKTGKLTVRVKDSDFYLKELPKMSKEDIILLVESREKELKNLTVPFDEPDWNVINDFYSTIRKAYL